jgi:predicted SAM-dependent methyltransferase
VVINIPWWVKITSKIILSRLPFGYRIWQRLGLFRHGDMDEVSYILGVFNKHVSRSGYKDLKGKTILELGPGDSIGTALIAASHGAKSILVDAGIFAVQDVQVYKKLAEDLIVAGLKPPDISDANTVTDILKICDSLYLTQGLSSLHSLKTSSVDFVFSQAVLEHIRKNEFIETVKEMRRILVSHGCASHRVDLKDHLQNSLNNLRFSESIWESSIFADSGFYTNRIRYSQMLGLFKDAGFNVNVFKIDRWDKLPINRKHLNISYANLADEELLVKGFDVVLSASIR